ncbi:hypothetical protein O6H91_17G086300 [Diphasiastrum complanatum]|uniref:Uncharacterized protein n=1 Tax=Diphasiastrum complanatum TaxID=34168 RepID=A0ACC2B8S6_DIPCM|nr:hypothetical protein O6H91_17G086300 [Diphasiastrum complanatum]
MFLQFEVGNVAEALIMGGSSMVWGEHVRVLLCLWHVKKAWLKNLCHMIEDLVTRKQLWEKLGQLLKRSYPSHYTYQQRVQESFDFLESLFTECGSTCHTFREYFRKEWMESEKMSMWLQVANDIQHANHEVNAAIECYHANLKRKHLCSRNRLLGKRMDWLLWVLADDIEWSYEHMEQAKPLDKAENFEDQKIVPSCFVEARLIPDHDVYLPPCTDESARVHSQSKLNVKYEVLNIGSEWACCTCPRSQKGNLCKHVIKVSLLHRQGESLRKSPDVEVAAKKRKTRQKSFSLHSPPPLCASDQHNQPPSYPPVQCSSQTASCAPMVITYAFPLVEHDQNNVFISLALMAHKQMQRLQELVHADPSLTTYYLTLLQEVEERLKRVQASKISLGIPQEQSSSFRFTDANMGSGLVFCQKPCTLPPTKLHVVKKPKRRPRRTYPKEVSTTNM